MGPTEGSGLEWRTGREGSLRELVRATVEQQEETPPAREDLIPGSVPFPSTAEGKSIDKYRAVQDLVDKFKPLLCRTGSQSTKPGSAPAELFGAGLQLVATCKGEVSEMVRTIEPQGFNPFVDVHK